MSGTFIISGARKLPGVKFTLLPIDNPVGFFFEAMYQTGFYWNFIGMLQIVLGVLILFNRTAVLTALLMMPITVNIFLVSAALQMKGTPFITTAMVMGNIILLLWNYENYLPLLKSSLYKVDT